MFSAQEFGARSSVTPFPMVGERRLRSALDQGEIYPVFQPIVALPGQAIMGFEVLARWNDPVMGNIPTEHFIQVAENAGLLAPLTDIVLERACVMARDWGESFRLSFNVSPLQFQTIAFAAKFEAIVRRTGFDVSRIELEITESAIINDLAAAQALTSRLKGLGVRIALDDFGTGFSSLTWLQALPFDTIKIDRSFVRSMSVCRDSRKIVSAVIGLGQSLGMPVIAEGVETPVEAALLTKLGCDFAQGYLFGRPADGASALDSLARLGRLTQPIDPLNLSCNMKLAQLNAIYAGAPIALCFVDMSRRFVSANAKIAELIGVGLERVVGQRVDDIVPDALPLTIDVFEKLSAGRVLPPSESISADRRKTFLTTVSAAHDEGDQMVGISVAIVDITQHKSSVPTRTFGKRPAGPPS